MNIRNTLRLNALIAILSTLTIGITGFIFTSNVADVSLQLFDHEAVPLIKINQMEKTLQGELLRLIGHVSAEDPDKMDRLASEIHQRTQQLDHQTVEYQQTLHHGSSQAREKLFQLFVVKREQFDTIGDHILALSTEYAKTDALQLVLGKGKAVYDESIAALQHLIEIHQQQMMLLRQQATATRTTSATVLLIIIVLTVSGTLISGWFLIQLILPIRLLQKSAEALTKGDLDVVIDTRRNDELGELAKRFAAMRDAIRDKINTIETLNQNLEVKIEQRTAELASSRDQALAASHSKSEFLANMSHEIRTPMNAVIGMTHLMIQTDLNQQQLDYIHKLESASQSLLGIINDILDFSKIEAGKMRLEKIPFDLTDELQILSNIMVVRAQEKGLSIHFSCHPNLPPRLIGDPLRFRQVLLNLINNAIKFTDQGTITVSIRSLSTAKRNQATTITLECSVKDTGIGLTKAQINKLFCSFSQADTSTTRKHGGTGLGLAICKQLVQLMDGDIWVESELGCGSRFVFTSQFLCDEQQHADTRIPSNQYTDMTTLSGARILVVEDDPVNQQIAREVLQHAGLTVVIANNGKEAVQKVCDAPFDAILMDIQMPEMDGYEATKIIRQQPRFKELPIIAMTAHAITEEKEKCLAIGMNGHTAKPIDVSHLFALLRQWITLDNAVQTTPVEEEQCTTTLNIPPSLRTVINIDALLKMISGDEQLLISLLSDFHKVYAHSAQQMRSLLNQNDIQAAEQLAHKIKGTSGNLSAMSLYDAAAQLTHALRQQQQHGERITNLEELVDRFATSLDEIMAAIADLTLAQQIHGPQGKQKS